MSRTNLVNKIVYDEGISGKTTTTVRYGPQWYSSAGVNSPPSTTRTTVRIRKTTINRSGTVTPYYSSALKRPVPLPVNAFSFTKEVLHPHIVYSRRLPVGFSGQIGTITEDFGAIGYATELSGVYLPEASVINAAHRDLQNKLLLRVKGQKVNLAQATAERKQTVDLIVKNLGAIGRAYSHIRRGDIVGAAKSLGVSPPKDKTIKEIAQLRFRKRRHNHGLTPEALASQRWLELQYGWKPLLGDIYGSVEAYHKSRRDLPVFQRCSVSKVLTRTYEEREPPGSVDSYVIAHRCVTTLRYMCLFRQSSPVTKTLSELGITNPALIAWELTPWSFVVDWFLPIGDFISTFDATLGVTFESGYSSRSDDSFASKVKTLKPTSSYLFRVGEERQTKTYFSYTRSPLTAFPSPQFPLFKDPVSPAHLANAVALFITSVKAVKYKQQTTYYDYTE